jgi:tRNA pseudouridine55 synthase
MAAVTIDDARAAAATLTGDILQIPPMVSAVRVDGRRLHELAREGIEVDRAARPVRVDEFTVEPTPDHGVLSVRVRCSSGTYIRTLADDLGRLLGGGAHLRNLRRTAVGSFTDAEAQAPDVCTLRPTWMAMRDHQLAVVDASTADEVRHGRVLARFDGDGPWGVMSTDGELIAVYEPFRNDLAKPVVVLDS